MSTATNSLRAPIIEAAAPLKGRVEEPETPPSESSAVPGRGGRPVRVLLLGANRERLERLQSGVTAEIDARAAATLDEARAAFDGAPDGLVLDVASGASMFLARLVRELPFRSASTVALVDDPVLGGCALELGAEAVVAVREGETLEAAGARAMAVCPALRDRDLSPERTSGRGYALLLESHRKLLAQTVAARQDQTMLVHDLRAPLQVLRGVHAEVRHAYLDRRIAMIMERSVDQLASLIDRLEALDTTEPMRPERLNARSVAEVLAAQLEVADPDGAPIRVVANATRVSWTGDRRLLERTLVNLLTNARRHAKERVEVQLQARRGGIRIAVLDDGPGIPHELRDNLFRRYVKSPETGRLGLGLAIVKRAAERLGGSVCAANRADAPFGATGGACFIVRLPTSGARATAGRGSS